MSNLCLEAVEHELVAAGVVYRTRHGGKHLHVEYGAEFQHAYIVPVTSSDRRAHLNARSDIRKQLIAQGYIVDGEVAAPAPVIALTDGSTTCVSYHIAEHFSKAHKDVLRTIDRIRDECGPEFDRRNFTPISYQDDKGRSYRAYRMTRDGFTLVVMGFTGQAAMAWKLRYIDAFNAMERELQAYSGSDEVRQLRGDVEALTDLLAEVESRQPVALMAARPKGVRFIRPSVLRKQRRAARA